MIRTRFYAVRFFGIINDKLGKVRIEVRVLKGN